MAKLTPTEQQAARKLGYFQNENGMWVFHATLPQETGALVIRAIEAGVASLQDDRQAQKHVSAETQLRGDAGHQMDRTCL